jgi:hypothetical protein
VLLGVALLERAPYERQIRKSAAPLQQATLSR